MSAEVESNPNFIDRLIDIAQEHPDENDPYWDHFWTLKSSSEMAYKKVAR